MAGAAAGRGTGRLFLVCRAAGRPGRLSRGGVRYAFLLQLQGLAEAALLALYAALATAAIHILAGALGDLETQASMLASVGSGSAALAMFTVGLMLPAVSMLAGSLRMHALSHTPGALAGAIDGSLARKDLVLPADASDARIALVRHLERLTDKDMPGLGRILYGSHPRLTSRDAEGHTVHELVWWQCPMKLLVSMRQLDDGRQQVRVRCVLRGGMHRLELVATPADTLAQMQYIEAHLLAPLGAQLARVSAERERDALHGQAVESQLRILQAQIEPHFLFNTLANVRQLYRSSVASGEHMMDHLIAYLQCAMDDLRAEESTVVKEMDLAMHYLSIMKIRMGQRLSYSFALPDALLQHRFPPAMLISLVENAIKHGLADRDSGAVVLCAEQAGSQLRVTVADPHAGQGPGRATRSAAIPAGQPRRDRQPAPHRCRAPPRRPHAGAPQGARRGVDVTSGFQAQAALRQM
jgi:hypothetical protein